MQLRPAIQEAELRSKLAVKTFGVVANDIQSAARLRTIRPEGRHDDVTARLDREGDLADVSCPIFGLGQEVEHRSVMPKIVPGNRQLDLGDVAGDPMHGGGGRAKPGLRHLDGRLRNVEHCHVTISACDKVIDQGRLPATDINDRAATVRRS